MIRFKLDLVFSLNIFEDKKICAKSSYVSTTNKKRNFIHAIITKQIIMLCTLNSVSIWWKIIIEPFCNCFLDVDMLNIWMLTSFCELGVLEVKLQIWRRVSRVKLLNLEVFVFSSINIVSLKDCRSCNFSYNENVFL